MRSILDRLGGQIPLYNQGYLEGDSVVEFPQIQTGELADLFQTVYQGVSVYEQLPGSFGYVQVVFEETLDGHEGFSVQSVQTAVLENFLQEHFAQGGGQLIDQTADTQVFIADDVLFGVEYLTNFQSNLGFLVGTGQILDVVHNGTDPDGNLGVEFGVQGMEDVVRLPGVVSRKKQVVPELMMEITQ